MRGEYVQTGSYVIDGWHQLYVFGKFVIDPSQRGDELTVIGIWEYLFCYVAYLHGGGIGHAVQSTGSLLGVSIYRSGEIAMTDSTDPRNLVNYCPHGVIYSIKPA